MIDYIFRFFKLDKKKDIVNQTKPWKSLDIEMQQVLLNTVKITGVYQTIDAVMSAIIANQKGAYLRFGDGDIMLLHGLSEMMHESNPMLSKEMEEAFMLSIGEIHKTLPIHSEIFGFENGMKKGMHIFTNEEVIKFISNTYQYFVGCRIYSHAALHYLSVFDTAKCVDFLIFLKEYTPVFVGNEDIKESLIEKLFGSEFIKTPNRNSYLEIDEIESQLCEVLNNNKEEFKIVVVAMGCAGRVLQKRILKKGYNVYLFDFGSLLDAFNGLETRTWIRMSGVKNLQKILDNV